MKHVPILFLAPPSHNPTHFSKLAASKVDRKGDCAVIDKKFSSACCLDILIIYLSKVGLL